jgi:hypothetical protein
MRDTKIAGLMVTAVYEGYLLILKANFRDPQVII